MIFWPAWQNAFTKNVASSRSKTSLTPWNPGMVPAQLRSLQRDHVERCRRSGQPSSSPSVDLDPPTTRGKIRAVINQVVELETKKSLPKISDELTSEKVKNKILKIEKKKALEALKHGKKQGKRGKKLMKEFRSHEQTSAVIFSPRKVRKCLEREACIGQAKEQPELDKALTAAQGESEKEHRIQEAQQKRGDRVAALTAKKEAAAFQMAAKVAVKAAVMVCSRCTV
jgi:hypothetical protein